MKDHKRLNQTKPIIDRKNTVGKFMGQGVIKYHIIFRLAFKNIVYKKLRTTLTVMGVVIGVGCVLAGVPRREYSRPSAKRVAFCKNARSLERCRSGRQAEPGR